MRRNYALEDDELAAGYVLTCQAIPSTDVVTVDYDV
jgi:ring-1,2-phenylacetyl-CoA epoxidase subunit PaaE